MYQFKYQPYLSDLQTVLGDLLYENLIQNELFVEVLETRPVLVPIPLSKAKLRKRGYNQAELLAKGLSKEFGLQVQNLLKRAKETKPQYGLSRGERMENMKNAFAIVIPAKAGIYTNKEVDPGSKSGMATLLVDDVLTTDSTLKEAAKVLKKNGFEKVWGIVLAQD